MKQKVCTKCNQEKPISEYYVRPNGTIYSTCKACHKSETSKHKHTDAKPPDSEIRCVAWLRSLGIPAMHGRSFRGKFGFIDIVVFGCVRIEVKVPKQQTHGMGTERIFFQHKQLQKNDVVIIETDAQDYHVYPATHPAFYYPTGLTRRTVGVTDMLLKSGHNRVDVIETTFNKRRVELARVSQPQRQVQLTLFDSLEEKGA